jgi:tellurite resistance protein TerC
VPRGRRRTSTFPARRTTATQISSTTAASYLAVRGAPVGIRRVPIPEEAAPGAAEVGLEYWAAFFVLVIVLLAFDLLVVNRKAHVIPVREAMGWSAFWIAISLGFNAWVLAQYGQEAASDFFAAYLTEKALSVDNLFVFMVIFNYYQVPPQFRHRVLFYGILGALVMRGVFIFAGIELLKAWEPVFFLFGGFLLFTGWKLLRAGDAHFQPDKSVFYRFAMRFLPVVSRYEGGRFVVREGGRWCGTTLFVVLFVVEGTDVVFALDSVPACIGITRDTFIVYTSNVFAILGLRALFFLLQDVLERLPGLQTGLALVLGFVGVKMVLLPKPFEFHIDSRISMGIIVALLAGSWAVATLHRSGKRGRQG